MILIGLLVLCAIVSAIIASNKNRSAFGWFLLGLFLGFIAVIIIAVLAPLTPNQAAISAGGPRAQLPEKTCPKCAENVKSAATVCRFCGYDFTAASQPAASSPG